MTINLNMPATHQLKPRITVVGIGGAGGNAVNNMITSHLEGVEFVVANTDAQALAQSLSDRRIQLGANITQGLGAGSRPDVGRAAAEEAIDEIVDHLQGSNMVFITAGMGGGTGTGGGPVVAQVAREQGILTVAVVTKPFNFEGVHRMRLAEDGLHELQQYVDTLIIIPNQNLFRVANEKTTFADAFKMADDVLYSGVRGVTDLMVMPGLINLDFADVRTVMAEMGTAMMGTGEAEGERRAVDSAESAISNPLLDDVSMKGARGVLINITGGYDMTLFEVDEAANRIREEVDPEANIIFGSTFDESLAGRMRVSVVATGIQAEARSETGDTTATARPALQPAISRLRVDLDSSDGEKEKSVDSVDREFDAEEVAAEPAPEPAPVAAMTASEPIEEGLAVGRVFDDDFIPPAPAEPARRKPVVAHAEPFAAAAMANGAMSRPAAEPQRPRSLFERVTGAGRIRQPRFEPEPQPEPQPELAPVLESVDAMPARGDADTVTLPQVEEDLLDIPAFLRRRAT